MATPQSPDIRSPGAGTDAGATPLSMSTPYKSPYKHDALSPSATAHYTHATTSSAHASSHAATTHATYGYDQSYLAGLGSPVSYGAAASPLPTATTPFHYAHTAVTPAATTAPPAPAATGTPQRQYIPAATGTPQRQYIPAATGTPQRQYIPAATGTPQRQYIPAATGTPQRQYIPAASPSPVTPYAVHADPMDDALINSAAKVRSLARATSEASFSEEMSGCRYAAARARTSITEATLQNLQGETDERLNASQTQQRHAQKARRNVDSAAKQADAARYKQLMAEKQLITTESERLREEARIARLEALATQSQSDVEYLHRSKHATETAYAAAKEGLMQTKEHARSVRRSVERSEVAKTVAEEKLRTTYGELSHASLEVNQHREDLILATEKERDAMLRRAAARNMETAALTYLTKIAPTSPARVAETRFAVEDIESARIAERAAETIASEARCTALVANDRLRDAEDRLIGANTHARMTDNEFRDVATELEIGRAKLGETQTHLQCAKAIEKESLVQTIRTKEEVVLNAQKLAQRRVALKRSKDRLKKLSVSAESKKKEAIRQFQNADVAEKVFVNRITNEQQARIDAEAALARARAAQESLTQTAVGLAYARQEEMEAMTEHDVARQNASVLRHEMEYHAATLQHLQTLSPRAAYLQSPERAA